MNTHVKSAPTLPGATGPSAHRTLVALIGGGVVLAAALGASVYARSNGSDSATPPVAYASAPVAREAGPAATVARARTQHVYLVTSDDQAERAWAAINYGNGILASLGEPLLLDSVVVVPSDVQASEVADAVAEGNRVALSLGLAEKTVVDLR